jgi:hypothetical protein
MDRREVAALIAYADRLDPARAVTDQAAAAERLTQWHDLLHDVPPTAPHPEGRHWDASDAVRRHIATSPYPIKPSDVSRPWHAFRSDVLRRHVDPVPNVDPDNAAAYRAAIAGHRHAIETGATVATPRALLPGETGTREQRDQSAAKRLRELGTYVPRAVAAELAGYRPHRAERERLAAAGRPDPLDVPCPVGTCRAAAGRPCTYQGRGDARRPLANAHPSRLDAATHHHAARNGAAQ